jgi:hypothetical protein
MKGALGMVVVFLGLCSPLCAGGDSRKQPTLTLSLTFPDRQSVRLAVDLAIGKLARPGCSSIFEDFEMPDGRTPRSELDRLGLHPDALVKSLVFVDGSRDPVCRNGRAFLTTTPGSRLIRVCPGFAQLRDPGLTASLVLHESLHALGLGENPPSSRDITNRVERRCW